MRPALRIAIEREIKLYCAWDVHTMNDLLDRIEKVIDADREDIMIARWRGRAR